MHTLRAGHRERSFSATCLAAELAVFARGTNFCPQTPTPNRSPNRSPNRNARTRTEECPNPAQWKEYINCATVAPSAEHLSLN